MMGLEIEVKLCLLAEIVSYTGITEVDWEKIQNNKKEKKSAFGQQDFLVKSLPVFLAA